MEQIHAYSDMVVKYLLGREDTKDLLLEFINAVLEDSGSEPIVSVELKNPFNPKEFTADKLSILDLKAVDSTGRIYNIEIQAAGNQTFINRTLYYWSKIYSGQIGESQLYKSLKPVVCINLLNFNLIQQNDRYHTCFLIREQTDPSLVLSDHLMIHFLELPKMGKKAPLTTLEKWLLFFKQEGQSEETMKTILHDDPIFIRAHNEFRKFTDDELMRDMYENRIKAQRDYNQMMYDAREEGLEQGREQGLEQGLEQGREQEQEMIARNMLSDGLAIDTISKYTSLSKEEIEKLK